MNGIYPIGSCNLSEEFGDTTILDISIPENISSLLLLTKSTKNRDNNFTLQVIDTQFLEDQKEQIFSISEIQTKLNYLLEYTRLTMDVLKRHHTSYTRLTKNVAQKAADSIINHNGMLFTLDKYTERSNMIIWKRTFHSHARSRIDRHTGDRQRIREFTRLFCRIFDTCGKSKVNAKRQPSINSSL